MIVILSPSTGLSELVNNDDLLHKRLLMLWSRAAGQGQCVSVFVCDLCKSFPQGME